MASRRQRQWQRPRQSLSLESVDVLVKIFVSLRPQDIACCSLTCKLWHKAASDGTLWRHLCLQKWPSLSDPAFSCQIRSFSAFFSQRFSNSIDPDAVAWLSSNLITFFIDVSLEDRPFFSKVVTGSAVVKERLRFKLPRIPESEASSVSHKACSRDISRPFKELHVQLSVVRHNDGKSACLVNGFPTENGGDGLAAHQKGYAANGLRCVLMLIDNNAFLNFFW